MTQDPENKLLKAYSSVKTLSLNHLTAKQHLLMATCRDVALLPPLVYSGSSLHKIINIHTILHPGVPAVPSADLLTTLISARKSEYLLCAIWCIVSLYLTCATLDSLMVRWIVKYSTVAAILRMFSMSLMLVTLELLLLGTFSPQSDYYLHTWILISCILTLAYIWQSYLTSNLNYVRDKKNSSKKTDRPFSFDKKRTIDLYNITVFCVVPVGLASFITMVFILRNLFIQRLDVEQLAYILREKYSIASI